MSQATGLPLPLHYYKIKICAARTHKCQAPRPLLGKRTWTPLR